MTAWSICRVNRLLRGCHTGVLLPKDGSSMSVLEGLVDLARPDSTANLPWSPQPLLRAVCPTAGAQNDGGTLKVRVWVYFRRLLFEMIAYPPLIAVMRAIVPACSVRKTAELPALENPVFFSHSSSDSSAVPNYAFSLAGLMKSQVISQLIALVRVSLWFSSTERSNVFGTYLFPVPCSCGNRSIRATKGQCNPRA